jgi:hypothetical protein
MADTDPPNEIDDVERPTHRLVVSPNTDTIRKQPNDREQQQLGHHERDRESNKPMERRALLERDVADLVSDAGKAMIALDHCRMEFLF